MTQEVNEAALMKEKKKLNTCYYCVYTHTDRDTREDGENLLLVSH